MIKTGLILLSIANLSVAVVHNGGLYWALPLACIFLVTAVLTRSFPAIHVSLFCFLALLPPIIHPLARHWPWPLLLPLLGYLVSVLSIPVLRGSLSWFKPGRIGREVLPLMLIVVAGSALGLLGWYLWFRPDVNLYLDQMPALPAMLIPLAGLGFALLNAMMEEFAFRGLIMQSLDSALGRQAWANGLQALSFGLFHYADGFPNGIAGVCMTTVYGLLLGFLRSRSRGPLAPVIAHFWADLTIFMILVTLAPMPG